MKIVWRTKKKNGVHSQENCRNCRFGGIYHCHRHAPAYDSNDTMEAKWPSIYNNGLGCWCGDWESEKEKKKKVEEGNTD